MTDLISRHEAVVKAQKSLDDFGSSGITKEFADMIARSYINDLPSADPKRGKWLRSGSDLFPYECDLCGETNERTTPWCPHCGADMRGEEDEDIREGTL